MLKKPQLYQWIPVVLMVAGKVAVHCVIDCSVNLFGRYRCLKCNLPFLTEVSIGGKFAVNPSLMFGESSLEKSGLSMIRKCKKRRVDSIHKHLGSCFFGIRHNTTTHK